METRHPELSGSPAYDRITALPGRYPSVGFGKGAPKSCSLLTRSFILIFSAGILYLKGRGLATQRMHITIASYFNI